MTGDIGGNISSRGGRPVAQDSVVAARGLGSCVRRRATARCAGDGQDGRNALRFGVTDSPTCPAGDSKPWEVGVKPWEHVEEVSG